MSKRFGWKAGPGWSVQKAQTPPAHCPPCHVLEGESRETNQPLPNCTRPFHLHHSTLHLQLRDTPLCCSASGSPGSVGPGRAACCCSSSSCFLFSCSRRTCCRCSLLWRIRETRSFMALATVLWSPSYTYPESTYGRAGQRRRTETCWQNIQKWRHTQTDCTITEVLFTKHSAGWICIHLATKQAQSSTAKIPQTVAQYST